MSTSNSNSSTAVRATELFEELLESYDRMPMGLRRYVLFVLVPAGVLFVGTAAAALAAPLPMLVRVPVALLGVLALGSAVIYPKLQMESRRRGLENQLHLFITHMTVLSTTNIDRVEVFRTLAKEKEYGELADEMERIVHLVDTWNRSLDEACRRRARQVPSKPFADFLERLAYSLNAGQGISDFLLGEQDAMIQEFATIYESTIENTEVMRDLYLSMILSMTFAVVNAVILPILTGTDAVMTIAAVMVLFVFVQAGFYYVIRVISPYDPLWFQTDAVRTSADTRIAVALYGATALTGLFILLTAMARLGVLFGPGVQAFVADQPAPLLVAAPLAPLLIPGLVARQVENRIKDRDDEFPGFIRALGASESAKQSTTTTVLSTLRDKDFGTLSAEVENLYTRLSMRLDPEQAWFHFTAESSSYLIQKFSEMYLAGRRMGGEPKQLGELISENMSEVLQLRQKRKQSTVTLIGVIYGITAASSFTFFIGLKVVDILMGIAEELSLAQGSLDLGGKLLYPNVYDVAVIEFELTMIVLFNALLSALMIRLSDGGHKANAYLHFVLLTWVGSGIAVGTLELIGVLISV
ncbi:MAG: archaellar assembly protein FlaJ [Halobacteriales archaeon]